VPPPPRVLALIPLALAIVVPGAAWATHRQDPPPVDLESKAGLQRAVQETFCVSAPPDPGQTTGVTRCVDTVDLPPRRLSVVRPGEVVTISFRGATSISEGSAAVRVLGRRSYVYRFRLAGPSTRWRVRLRPRAYEVEVFARFETADGRAGDTSATLGLLVARDRPLAIVPVSALQSKASLAG
jgi:hypothetical protein